MPTFVDEPEIPVVGLCGRKQLGNTFHKSAGLLRGLGSEEQGIEPYVTSDDLHRVHPESRAELIPVHGILGSLPANGMFDIRVSAAPTATEG